jgi:hypothetical protein
MLPFQNPQIIQFIFSEFENGDFKHAGICIKNILSNLNRLDEQNLLAKLKDVMDNSLPGINTL